MKKKHKGMWIAAAAVALLGGGVAAYEYEKHKTLKVGPNATGTLTVQPGSQAVQFTGTGDSLTVALPSGAKGWTSVTYLGVTVPATGTAAVTIPLTGPGSATATWLDSSGATQTTTITVTQK